jgi:hypothetical protein
MDLGDRSHSQILPWSKSVFHWPNIGLYFQTFPEQVPIKRNLFCQRDKEWICLYLTRLPMSIKNKFGPIWPSNGNGARACQVSPKVPVEWVSVPLLGDILRSELRRNQTTLNEGPCGVFLLQRNAVMAPLSELFTFPSTNFIFDYSVMF